MRTLFLTLYPETMPSSRLRVYQYLPHLQARGIEADVMPALPEPFFSKAYYSKSKVLRFVQYLAEAVGTVGRALRSRAYEVVVIQKGLLLSNLRGGDRLFGNFGQRVIFDLDDAVYGTNLVEFRQPFLKSLQDGNQTVRLTRRSRAVIVGNEYLKALALPYNPRVYVIPTPVDTDRIFPNRAWPREKRKEIVIGWLGIGEGVKYFSVVKEALHRLAKRHPIRFQVVTRLTGKKIDLDGIKTEIRDWTLEGECREMNQFDIGISPLFDAPWERGKCSLKLLQFMAAGLPTVSSRAGMNQEIIEEGEDGFLASNTDEWAAKLERLIENEDLRKKIGESARQKVLRQYSLNKMASVLAETIRKVSES